MKKVEMTEEEEDRRRALRRSKFAPLPSLSSTSRHQSRLAHPGGPLTTNKAAALAKFLERKLQDPDGLSSINPDLIELAVKNAKDTVNASSHCGRSNSGRTIRHVASFGDSEDSLGEEKEENLKPKNYEKKKKKKGKKNKKLKAVDDSYVAAKKSKKSQKL